MRVTVGAARAIVERTLERAGVGVGGAHPFDVTVHDDAVYEAFVRNGLSGVRDAYVARLWDTQNLDDLAFRLLSSGVDLPAAGWGAMLWRRIGGHVMNAQRGERGREVKRHYELGNDLFEAMLDPRMVYSCAYWRDAKTLAAAQEAKLDLVCRKLRLQPGMRVLDVGCGWGGFARFAAERYGAAVVGITISEKQADWARAECRGLPVEIRLRDYRDLAVDQPFDAVASIGMFEHVGFKNYRRFFEIMRRSLRAEGLLLLHTIGSNRSSSFYDPWFDGNIFPNTHLPSAPQITRAAETLFVLEDWHNFGADYDRTLMAWFANFDRAWPSLRSAYGDAFYRMWKCFLLTSAGAFRARHFQTWQLVLSQRGVSGGYQAVR